MSTSSADPYRLPRTAHPERYEIVLEPDLHSGRFQGRVRISVAATPGAVLDELVLNAADLEIDECRVDGHDAAVRLEATTERLIVTPARPVEGHCVLEIAFRGELNDKLRGFYRSTYLDAEGVEQVIATTQMQSTDCRRAFPCWDEPDFKSVFAVRLIVGDGLLAISNSAEVDRRALDDGRWEITFADTILMSTYLVAFVVGPLEATESVAVNGVPVRIVHVPGKAHLTRFGLDTAVFCLDWFTRYYAIDYPGHKVDLVALPDFAAGAMENLGCITFRENLLLVDPANSTQNEQQLVVDVVAHELAHMWFGDLVTMRWWNGIWLNEAFATFMEIAACEAYRPDWYRWTAFGIERSVALETDSLASTRPVEYDVRSPADCEGMFDVLTYQKGGALLRMLEQYLGEERFRDGVRHYLTRHAYGNTETSDLWDAIESATGEPVRRLMDSWIWQPGYPLIGADLDGSDLVLSQRRFAFDIGDPPADATADRWVVPVGLRTGTSAATVLLEDAEIRVALDDPGAPVIVNAGGHGFVRVAYGDALRSRITGSVFADLDVLERYNLVDDAWNSVVAGRLEAASYLGFVEDFGAEREFAVWQAIALGLRGLGRLVEGEADGLLQRRIAALLGPVVDDLGDPEADESDLRGRLRGLLVTALAVLGGDETTQARCRSILDGVSASDPELLAAATVVVAASGGPADYERLITGFRTASTPQDQLRHLYALAEFDAAGLVERTCELAMSDEVKTQNAPFLLRMCIANRHHGARAWEFVTERWQVALDRFPSNTIVRMVDSVKFLTTPAQVEQVQEFFARHPIPQASETLRQILERQQINARLRERESERFAASLARR